jgi:endonuclease-3
MKSKEKFAAEIIEILKKRYKNIRCALNFKTPFELLVAVILSAQCTDKRVDEITKLLFAKYKSPKDYAGADILELEQLIKSAGFYRNKAKNIKNSAKLLIESFNGEMPQTMEQMLKFPGAARKTANVVLGTAFGKTEGIAVDTHVIRISNLLGLTKNDDAVKIEKDLVKIVPKKHWIAFSHLIQSLGREICKARCPQCGICPLNKKCPSHK